MAEKTGKPWVKAPIALLSDNRLTSDQIRLLLILLWMTDPIRDEAYLAWPGNAWLAQRLGCKPRWVAKLLRQLEGQEPTKRDEAPEGRHKDGQWYWHRWIRRTFDDEWTHEGRRIYLDLDYPGIDDAEVLHQQAVDCELPHQINAADRRVG